MEVGSEEVDYEEMLNDQERAEEDQAAREEILWEDLPGDRALRKCAITQYGDDCFWNREVNEEWYCDCPW